MKDNKSILDPLKHSGRPKYVAAPPTLSIPVILCKLDLNSSYIMLPKVIEDLERLMNWPVVSPYNLRISINTLISFSKALQVNKMSSAKSRWWIAGPWGEKLIPVIWSRTSTLFSMNERPSVHKTKRKGDRGSPCLIPLLGLTTPKAWSLISIE